MLKYIFESDDDDDDDDNINTCGIFTNPNK